jgi:hypothetical protein
MTARGWRCNSPEGLPSPRRGFRVFQRRRNPPCRDTCGSEEPGRNDRRQRSLHCRPRTQSRAQARHQQHRRVRPRERADGRELDASPSSFSFDNRRVAGGRRPSLTLCDRSESTPDFARILGWMNSRTSGVNNARLRATSVTRGARGRPWGMWSAKILELLRAADSDPSWAVKVPLFAAEIRRIFTIEELRAYFATTTRVGAAAHVATEKQYQTMCDADAFDDDVVGGAADAILFERARMLLLGGGASGDTLESHYST